MNIKYFQADDQRKLLIQVKELFLCPRLEEWDPNQEFMVALVSPYLFIYEV